MYATGRRPETSNSGGCRSRRDSSRSCCTCGGHHSSEFNSLNTYNVVVSLSFCSVCNFAVLCGFGCFCHCISLEGSPSLTYCSKLPVRECLHKEVTLYRKIKPNEPKVSEYVNWAHDILLFDGVLGLTGPGFVITDH